VNLANFYALSAVVGKTKDAVANSLADYARSVGGGLQQDDNVNLATGGCFIEEANGNTTVFYPGAYGECDDSSAFISQKLNAAVFSFHIYVGDLWMYVLYHNGQIVDRFNPVPDYWDDNPSDEEIDSWKGNAQTIVNCIPSIKIDDIDRYLVRWDMENENEQKAYPTDEYTKKDDWQMVDFMNKLKLPYPIDINGNVNGKKYKLLTEEFKG